MIFPPGAKHLPLVLAGKGPSVEVLRVCQHAFLPLERAVLLLLASGVPAGCLISDRLPFFGLVCSGAQQSAIVGKGVEGTNT